MIRTTLSLTNELAALGYAAIVGTVLGIYYDVFRIIRRVFRCNYANVVSQDIFFWTTSAVFVFFAAIISGDGIVRINFVMTALVCAFVYCITLGMAVTFAVSAVANTLKKSVVWMAGMINGKICIPLGKKALELIEKIKKYQKKGE